MTLLLLLACARPATFDCGKVICDRDQVCLHWDIPDTAPPDTGHGCVECDDAGDGVSCWGEEP